MQDIQSIINKFKNSSLNASTEEDVRICANIFLDKISDILELNKFAKSEVSSIQGGRADSIYSDIIFEFKKPKKLKSEAGINEIVFGRDNRDRGLFTYLVNFSIEELGLSDQDQFDNILLSKVGVGFDGKTFLFFRYKKSAENLEISLPNKTRKFPDHVSSLRNLTYEIEVINDFDLAIKKLLLFIRSTKRKRLSAQNLVQTFSSKSKISKTTILYLYELLCENLKGDKVNTRIKTLFEEWNRIFGDIYGKEETDFTEYKDDLITMYSLPKNMEIRQTLFVLQTYYSIVIKLLIHNLLESLSNPTKKAKTATFKHDLSSLFSGNHYTTYKIENFFEIHFFEWFILAEGLEMSYINSIISELDNFETTASVIKPEVVEDVLKKVYSDLIPRGLRHLLGEYYTPEWLVDFTIEKSRYNFELDTSILDPTCGSGAFITHIIKRLTDLNKGTVESNVLIDKITKNVVGFDINPIAVISAKANYILALGDITQLKNDISIPIYMCDSILVPTVHAKQREQKHAIEISTIVGNFEIPVFDNRDDNDFFLKTISNCILRDYTNFEECRQIFESTGKLNLDKEQLILTEKFYDKLYNLHLSGRNGFWPIILKNSFAPLFSQSKFDVIVGNPPWITWKAMSDTYRKATLDIWLSYGIFEKSAYDKITSHDDFAMAVTYVSIDHYLKDHGLTSFVLPQTFVKSSKGGEGFRKFKITRDGLDVPFAIVELYDMLQIKPFHGEASNRTSVYVFEKNKSTIYPMENYYECFNLSTRNKVLYTDSYESACKKMGVRKLNAKPINDNLRSPWLTYSSSIDVSKYLGRSLYNGRKGIEPCGAKGIYLVNVISNSGDEVIIENLIERSRLKKAKEYGVFPGIVEKDLIYPMVGGRNIDKWGINSYIYIVLPHKNSGEGIYRGIDESILRTKYRKTYNWLHHFKDILLETRIRSAKFFDEKQFPFYRLDNVGEYTFKPYKVLWREQSKQMTAVVVSTLNDKYLGEKIVVTDSKVLYVSFDSELEANYLCGILNSRVIGEIVEAYTIDTQRGVDIVKNIKIPIFDTKNKLHIKMAKCAKQAHANYLSGQDQTLIENEIEVLIPKIFN